MIQISPTEIALHKFTRYFIMSKSLTVRHRRTNIKSPPPPPPSSDVVKAYETYYVSEKIERDHIFIP